MAELHNRKPVILEKSDWPLWPGEWEGDHAAVLQRVGSPQNHDATLIESIDHPA